MWVALSNILRKVSWQREDDLRVRREQKNESDLQPIHTFLHEMHRTIKALVAFQLQSKADCGRGVVVEGDARTAHSALERWRGHVDAVVTSPPYATALPYLDTDRLSLTFLGFLKTATKTPCLCPNFASAFACSLPLAVFRFQLSSVPSTSCGLAENSVFPIKTRPTVDSSQRRGT